MSTPPVLLDDLRWMGFELMSHSNNHATDYGISAVLATLGHVRDRGIPCAGSGATSLSTASLALIEAIRAECSLLSPA